MISFKDYLASRRITPTPSGDFTKESRNDPAMAEIETWPQLRAHIFKKTTAEQLRKTIDAAEPVWKGYRASLLKARRED